MRSSTPFVFLALSSLVAPAIAAPTFVSNPTYAREEVPYALLARQAQQNVDQSGAFLPLLLSAGSALLSLFNHKRDINELTLRDLEQELLARADSDPQSGAFLPFLLSAIPAAISLFKGKREDIEMFTREAHTVAEFRAGIEEYLRTHGGHFRREDQESGAFLPLLLSAIPAAISLFKGKREFEDVFAREFSEELLARAAADDQSGAFLPLLLSAGSALLSLFHHKREVVENLLVRDMLQGMMNTQTNVQASSARNQMQQSMMMGNTRWVNNGIARSLFDLD